MCPPLLMPWPVNLPFLMAVAIEQPVLFLAPLLAVGAGHALVEVAARVRGRPVNRAGWMLPPTAALVAGVAAVLVQQLPVLTAPTPLSAEIVAPMARYAGITPLGLTVAAVVAGLSASLSVFDRRARAHAGRLATVGATLLTLAALVEVLRGRVLLWWMQGRWELVAVPGIEAWTDGARASLLSGLVVLAVVGLVRRSGTATRTAMALRVLRGAAIVAAGLAWQTALGQLTPRPAALLAGDRVAAVGLDEIPPFPCRKRPVAAIDAQMVSSARMPAPP